MATKKSIISLIAVFLLLSFSAFAWNFAEFESSPTNTHQQYKGDTAQTGLVYSTNPQIITNWTSCSIAEGQNYPIPVDDFTGDGKGDVVVYISNFLRMYNSSCSLKKSFTTSTSVAGYPIVYNLFDETTPALIVPEATGNISVYEYSTGVGNFVRRLNLQAEDGITNIGFVCDRLSSHTDRPTCWFVTNNNSVCAMSTTTPDSPRNYSNWATSCIGTGVSGAGNMTKKRIPTMNTYGYDIDDNPLYSLVFGFDANNDARFGIAQFSIETNSLVTSFNSPNGYVDNIYQFDIDCSEPSIYSEFYKSMATPLIYDFDDDGLGDIVVPSFTEDSISACSLYQWSLAYRVYKSDGSSNSIGLSSKAYGSATSPPSITEATLIYFDNTFSGNHFCINFFDGVSTNHKRCMYYTGSSIVTDGMSLSGNSGTLPVATSQEALHQLSFRNVSSTFNLDTIVDRFRIMDGKTGTMFFNLSSYALSQYLTIADVSGDSVSDIITSQSGTTKILTATGSPTSPNNAPVLNSITASQSNPVNRGSSVYYEVAVTDTDSSNIYTAVRCEVGDSQSSYSPANTLDTTHSVCLYDTIGCKTARLYVNDFEGGRTSALYETLPSESKKDYNVSVKVYCGDDTCDVSENYNVCPSDCSVSTCGDTTCQLTENPSTCPIDCYTSTCGNANCELNENFVSCPADCTIATCGNGYCEGSETTANCPYDTFQIGVCGDNICSAEETYAECPSDCPQITCGNLICNLNENSTSCPVDCGTCGNGVCEGLESSVSSSSYCVQDCPSPDFNFQTGLVDINAENPTNPEETEGLLPELYLGIIAFFTPFLIPLLSLLFIVGLVLAFKVLIDKFS